MHYAENPGSVRVEFFKPSGTWYMTEAWDMSAYYLEPLGPAEAVRKMLDEEPSRRGAGLRSSFIVVVLDPYHKHAFPVCLVPRA